MNDKQEVRTFCRVCEPVCGVIAELDDGRIVGIRSDPDHVLSQGHFCKKAMAAVDITYDPDRLRYPMKRTGGPGEFTRISWEQAYSEISERLRSVRERHGAAAFATYSGNPTAFSAGTMLAMGAVTKALDVKWRYTVNGEDGVSIVAASEMLYGTPVIPKPDFWHTSFALIVGANPVGSHGSVITEPIVTKALKSIVERGGRVVVVDPRCSETAQKFEHVAIRAGADAYFLSALLRELIDQGFADQEFVQRHTRDFAALRTLLEPCTVDWAEAHSGMPAQTIRDLARAVGCANGAAIYGRTGTCTQRHGTLANLLMQLISIVSGNLDRAGGSSFGWSFVDYHGAALGSTPSRTTGLPDVTGMLGSASLASDIDQPGAEQIRALLMVAANPLLSAPASARLQAALQNLDLFFSIDLYINESNRFADYVLPGTTMWERADVPLLAMMGYMLRPSVFATDAVIAQQGEVRDDAEIIYEICRRLGVDESALVPPRTMIDGIIRGSRFGDRFGENPDGLTLDKLLREHPHGVRLLETMPVGIIDDVLATADKRIALASPPFAAALKRLIDDDFFLNPEFPLRLHSLREVLTHNSWMHNAVSLARGGRTQYARLHPADAAAHGIEDGAEMRIRSPYGNVVVACRITEHISRGNIALPHGWEHAGGWQLANRRGGVNSNRLASAQPADTDPFSGSSVLNGIPVSIAPAA
jgi:anaerobic selenocysteine-containing dehydrogenase